MNLLSITNYLFNSRPALLPKTGVALLILVGLACLFLYFLAKKKQKLNSPAKELWHRADNFAVTNLSLSWLMAFFYYEGVPFFSARFWLLLWGLINLLYGLFIFKKIRQLPARLAKIKEEKEFKKYIPKKAQ